VSTPPAWSNLLLHARIEAELLTLQQLHGCLMLLTATGNETTRNATAGDLIALLGKPDQRDLPSDAVRTSVWDPVWRESSCAPHKAHCC
jgi:cytochrome P450